MAYGPNIPESMVVAFWGCSTVAWTFNDGILCPFGKPSAAEDKGFEKNEQIHVL